MKRGLKGQEDTPCRQGRLERAARLIAQGKARDAEEQRRVLSERVASAEQDLQGALAKEEPLIQREVELLRQLAAVREQRWMVHLEAEPYLAPLHRAHYAIHGETYPNSRVPTFRPSADPVYEILKAGRPPSNSNWGDVEYDALESVMPTKKAYEFRLRSKGGAK
jgi:hypothetical protein